MGNIGPILLPEFRGTEGTEMVIEALDMNFNHPAGEPDPYEVVELDYKILPVAAAVEWNGAAGPQRLVMTTIITAREKYSD